MYPIVLSFFNISALVALVPIPLPFICALNSSSSISCPAFSIARIMEPELYLLGGEVSPSLIENSSTGRISPFLTFFSACSVASSFSSLSWDFAKEFFITERYPSLERTLNEADNNSFFTLSETETLVYSAEGKNIHKNLLAITSYTLEAVCDSPLIAPNPCPVGIIA